MEQELQDLLNRGAFQEVADALDRRGFPPNRYRQLMRWFHHLDEMDLVKRRKDIPQGLFTPCAESPFPTTFVIKDEDHLVHFVKVPQHLVREQVRSLWFLDFISEAQDDWGEVLAVVPPHGDVDVQDADPMELHEFLGPRHFVSRRIPDDRAFTQAFMVHRPKLAEYLLQEWQGQSPWRTRYFDNAVADLRSKGLLEDTTDE